MSGGDYHHHHPLDQRLVVRTATLDDLEDITTVAQEGFPGDPEFNYRFPYRGEFPEDNRKLVRQEYKEYFEQLDKYAVIIVGASDNDNKCVALSVWDILVTSKHKGGDLGIPDDPKEPPRRRDANPDHFRQFARGMDGGFERFFGAYGNNQIYLRLLCTHPSFRRRGAGARLCQWGLERAAMGRQHATVLASPMGKRLYESLGFALCGSFVIRVDKEPEELEIWALSVLEGS